MLERFKKIMKTSFGILSSQILNIISIPILARLYTPEDYTQFGIQLSLVVVLANSSSAKYSNAINAAKRESSAIALGELSLRIALAINLCLAPFILLFSLISGFGISFAFFTLISIASVSLVAISNRWLIRKKLFFSYTLLVFLMLGLVPILQFLFKDLLGNGLVVGASLAHLTAGIVASFFIPKKMWPTSFSTPRRVTTMARRYLSFPKFSLPSFFLSSMRVRLPYFTLAGGISDPSFLGLFAQADRMLGAPVNLMTTALRPQISDALSRGASPKKLVQKYLLVQWGLLTVPTVFIFKNISVFTSVILGPGWDGTAKIIKIMLLPAFLMMTTSWFDHFYDFSRKHHIIFKTESFFGACALIILAIAGPIMDQPLLAITLYSGVMVIYHITWITALLRASMVPWKNTVLTFLYFIIISSLAFVVMPTLS